MWTIFMSKLNFHQSWHFLKGHSNWCVCTCTVMLWHRPRISLQAYALGASTLNLPQVLLTFVYRKEVWKSHKIYNFWQDPVLRQEFLSTNVCPRSVSFSGTSFGTWPFMWNTICWQLWEWSSHGTAPTCHQSPQEPQECHLCVFLLGNTALFISQFKLNSKLIFFNSEIHTKCCLCFFLGYRLRSLSADSHHSMQPSRIQATNLQFTCTC